MFPRILTRFNGDIWREFMQNIKKWSFRGQLLLTPERIERILCGDSLVLWSWSLCLMRSLHNKSFALRQRPLTQETSSFRTRVGKSNPPNEYHPFISPAKGFFLFKWLKEWKESYMRQDDTKLKFNDYEATGWLVLSLTLPASLSCHLGCLPADLRTNNRDWDPQSLKCWSLSPLQKTFASP